MAEDSARPDNPGLTQTQPVMPSLHPSRHPPEGRDSSTLDPGLLAELRQFADRVGGLERLKAVIEELLLLRR